MKPAQPPAFRLFRPDEAPHSAPRQHHRQAAHEDVEKQIAAGGVQCELRQAEHRRQPAQPRPGLPFPRVGQRQRQGKQKDIACQPRKVGDVENLRGLLPQQQVQRPVEGAQGEGAVKAGQQKPRLSAAFEICPQSGAEARRHGEKLREIVPKLNHRTAPRPPSPPHARAGGRTLSWGRVSDPKEVVELDQKLNVVILDFDDEKKRIALGLKQLTPHPWDALDANLQVGDKVKGKVVVMADYGAFIEIAPGVEGLIHVSEMSWSQHLRSAQDFMKVGDEVEAVILTLDRDERKMSLGIKQLKQDPWETIEEKYPVGSKHTAKVRNFTNFGVFVEIEEGVDGLIHISDLSWTKKVKHPSEFTQIGADIEVQVLEIDKENRRLSLGHKQLEENPWDVFETVFTVGSVHEGTIIEMLDKGAVVALPYGVEGFATPKHLVKEDGSQAQLDEKLSFKVIEFNKDAKRIILSHSRIFEDAAKAEERAEKKAASNAKKTTKREEAPAIQNQAASTTLGDIDALAALKEQLENKKK